MPESIQDTLKRLLRYQRSPTLVTQTLRTWKHNADILPRIQAQLEVLLEAHGKFEPVVYDTQGIHDDGVDIVLRYRPKYSNQPPELIGFQVKSFDDLKKKSYMQELKAQHDDAFRKVLRLRYLFIVLCTDSKAHKEKVRSIMAEFRSADRTEVIDPEFAFTFLHHPRTRIEAHVKRVMEAEDLVFRLALESVDLPSPSARALIVFLAVRFALIGSREFAVDNLLAEPALRYIYEELCERQAALLAMATGGGSVDEEDGSEELDLESDYEETLSDGEEEDDEESPWEDEEYWEEESQDGLLEEIDAFEPQLARDLALLESDAIDSDSGAVILRPGQMRPLNAVVMDALARYEYDEEHLLAYMFSLFGVRD